MEILLFLWAVIGLAVYLGTVDDYAELIPFNNKKQLCWIAICCGPVAFGLFLMHIIWYWLGKK